MVYAFSGILMFVGLIIMGIYIIKLKNSKITINDAKNYIYIGVGFVILGVFGFLARAIPIIFNYINH